MDNNDNICRKKYPCFLCSYLPSQCKKIKLEDELTEQLKRELEQKEYNLK